MPLSEQRFKAVRAALRAHDERTHSPSRRTSDRIRMDPAQNADLAGALTDLIADSLLAADQVGLDSLAILSAAVSHVPGLAPAHYMLGRVLANRDEARAAPTQAA